MTDNEDEIRRALAEYDRALADVRKALPGKPGFGTEARFGQAYQLLVRLGVKPQLRGKYRG